MMKNNVLMEDKVDEFLNSGLVRNFNLGENIKPNYEVIDSGMNDTLKKVNETSLELNEAREALEDIKRKAKGTYGFERTATKAEINNIKNKIGSLNAFKEKANGLLKEYSNFRKIVSNGNFVYPMIDLNFLRKPKEISKEIYVKGDFVGNALVSLPPFAVYDIKGSNRMTIAYDAIVTGGTVSTWTNVKEPHVILTASDNLLNKIYTNAELYNGSISDLPWGVRCLLEDSVSKLSNWKLSASSETDTAFLHIFIAEYTTLFGKDVAESERVRQEIKKAKQYFGDICIISEVPEWQYNQEARILPRPRGFDPLVIGLFKGWNLNGQGFFITSFDATPLEKYVMNNYVGNKSGRN